MPLVAKMSSDLLEFDEKPRQVKILDEEGNLLLAGDNDSCLLYTSPSPRDRQKSRMPSSA